MIYYEREFVPYVPPVIPEGYELVYSYTYDDGHSSAKDKFDIEDLHAKKLLFVFYLDNYDSSNSKSVKITSKIKTDKSGDTKLNSPCVLDMVMYKESTAFYYGVIDCADGVITGYGNGSIVGQPDRTKNIMLSQMTYKDNPDYLDTDYEADEITALYLTISPKVFYNSLDLNYLRVYAM